MYYHYRDAAANWLIRHTCLCYARGIDWSVLGRFGGPKSRNLAQLEADSNGKEIRSESK